MLYTHQNQHPTLSHRRWLNLVEFFNLKKGYHGWVKSVLAKRFEQDRCDRNQQRRQAEFSLPALVAY